MFKLSSFAVTFPYMHILCFDYIHPPFYPLLLPPTLFSLVYFLYHTSSFSTFTLLLLLLFFKFLYMRKNVVFVFCVWLIWFNLSFSSIHFPVNSMIMFFMAEWYSILHMHTFFIYFYIKGHLDWFYILAIVTSATIIVGMWASLLSLFYMLTSFPSGVVEQNHIIVVFLVFCRTSILFSIGTILIYKHFYF